MKYTGKFTNNISFPLGGIGSGCIGLGGDGRLIDWEVFNRPSKGSINGCSHIAVKSKNSDGITTKILNGDFKGNLIGQYMGKNFCGFGYGPQSDTMCGFPHFESSTFTGEFPIAKINFTDKSFPAEVSLTAFNPFIPLDDKNSSIPAAFFEIEFKNNSLEATEYQAAFSLKNPFKKTVNQSLKRNNIRIIQLTNADVDEQDVEYGDLSIATDCACSISQEYWYRGSWRDPVVIFWNEFNSTYDLIDRKYDEPGESDTCTLVGKVLVAPGDIGKVKFVLTWNIPNNYNYWSPINKEDGSPVTWKNYYATIFKDSAASACYSIENWDSLYDRTVQFKNILFSTSLDSYIIDAISSNLSVLKSSTVLRLEDGSFYGWEGVHEKAGSCEGTCQHVWNYAYALCFLFPKLERSIRDAELKYATLHSGQTIFRLKLPYGRNPGDFRACLDGQMGTVFKCYREWKVSGDDEWLKSKWNVIKSILEYAWSPLNSDKWDRNKDGVLEGCQHHTLDMELYGPSSWLEGMYLLALKSAAEMANYLGDMDKCREYFEIFKKGYDWTKNNLFNGKYFIQKIDINDKDILNEFNAVEKYWNDEKSEIKYQIADGSSIDQMLGQWHSKILGLGNIFDTKQVVTALSSMMDNNFKSSMRNFVNPWRIFSLDDEAGTVICDYPNNIQKPAIPIPYCEETMTGFEYAFAGQLALSGKIDEAVKIVKSVRTRYNGEKRNPWNEIECGSNYARSMASYALLPIFSGFEFDMPHNHIGFNPLIHQDNFSCLWSLETGWGNFEINLDQALLQIVEGELLLSSIGLKCVKKIKNISIDDKKVAFAFNNGIISFSKTNIKKSVVIELCET